MHTLLDIRTATPHFPGIGRYIRGLTASLPGALNHADHLTLLHPSDSPTSWLHANKRIASFPTTNSPFSLSQQWQIPGLIQKSGATLYHSPYYLMPYRPGLPTVLTVYDLIPLHYPQTTRPRVRLLFRLMTILALRTAWQVIAISEAARQDFIRTLNVPAEKITAIPLAAEAHFQPQTDTEMARIRAKYGLYANFALYLGINKPHKNLPRLIAAWQRLRPDFELIIAGAWDAAYPEARQKAEGDDSIRFLGPVTEADLPGLYAAADLFIFASLYEGFGLPVLEAMACGTAVACSRASSLPEVAGETAFYFDPLRVESIAETLGRALEDDDLRREKALAGQARAQGFSWDETARQTVAVWRKLIADGARSGP